MMAAVGWRRTRQETLFLLVSGGGGGGGGGVVADVGVGVSVDCVLCLRLLQFKPPFEVKDKPRTQRLLLFRG